MCASGIYSRLWKRWAPRPAHADQATEAIMTSDTRPKQVAVEFKNKTQLNQVLTSNITYC